VPRALVLLVLALALTPRTSRADPGEADTAIERGVRLREQGRDDQAFLEFKHAYELSPTPRARAQLGLVEQALGQWVSAEDHLRGAVATRGDAWIESHRPVLESALATIGHHLGSLELRGKSPTGDVYVDGIKVATLPLDGARRVEVGTRTLEVRASGFYPVSRTIIVTPGETTRETIDLVPLPVADSVAPAPLPAPGEAARPIPETPLRPSSGIERTLAYVGFGLAGASLALAFVGLGERASEISAYNAETSCPGAASPAQPASCESHLSAASTWRTVSIASFVGAGVLGATSVVLLATAPRRSPASTPGHSVACAWGFAEVGCRVAF
jgi:hypothetical protein